MRVVCISDTHGHCRGMSVPDGDILIHAGDLSMNGMESAVHSEIAWIRSFPHQYKIVIAGNHDWVFQKNRDYGHFLAGLYRSEGLFYLQDEWEEIPGFGKIYGSPWQPWFHDWAFNLPRGGSELKAKWAGINDDTKILITHGPPFGIGDLSEIGLEHTGCSVLSDRIAELKQLQLHVFGHIHEGYGQWRENGVIYVNAASVNLQYNNTNRPIVVDL